jgi:hypothetical protein
LIILAIPALAVIIGVFALLFDSDDTGVLPQQVRNTVNDAENILESPTDTDFCKNSKNSKASLEEYASGGSL